MRPSPQTAIATALLAFILPAFASAAFTFGAFDVTLTDASRARDITIGGSDSEGLIKFNVSGVEGAVSSATLRLYNINVLPGTISVSSMETGWDETTVTWNNAPAGLEQLDAVVDPATGQYAEWDVTSLVTANGTHSFRLTHTNAATAQDFQSRDGAANAPELVVTFETGARIAAWRRVHFGTTANAGAAANDFDFETDGLVNLLEYALKRSPASGAAPDGTSAQPNATTNRPEPLLAGRLVLEIDMPEQPPADVVYEVLESEDLITWTVIARRSGAGLWTNLGSGAPIQVDAPLAGRVATAVGSRQTLDPYGSGRVFLMMIVTESP